jgi:DNA-binding MarR family transcriptional regulator
MRHEPATHEELGCAIREIEALLDRLRAKEAQQPAPAPGLLERAELMYQERRARDRLFGTDLFGEAAWDMLLDLYIHHGRNTLVPVSSACIGAAVPPSTALRCLGKLEASGLVMRRADVDDRRRSLVTLSDKGRRMMELYLASSWVG